MAVILLLIGLQDFIFHKNLGAPTEQQTGLATSTPSAIRHPLSGQILVSEQSFFPIAVMLDNSYNIRPQAGLGMADIVYEALAESNITRLMAIYDSQRSVEKIGPVRSARPYFMDWAEEYKGIYMHVGGSPQALAAITDYDFINIDQIGAGETYFWRDKNLRAPSNVFTSSSNWLRAGEMKAVQKISTSSLSDLTWHYEDLSDAATPSTPDVSIDYSAEYYKVEWRYNQVLKAYQRWQNNTKFIYDNGEQAQAQNVVIQIAPSHLIDTERRSIDTHKKGAVVVFNAFGQQSGEWQYSDGRTRFLSDIGEELKLVPGKTWVQVIDNREQLIIK